MKIYLFYPDKIYHFILPKDIEGSYGFDTEKNSETKLINIEARDGRWVIFSVDGVELYYGNNIVKEVPIADDSFYLVGRKGKKYLIYVRDISADKMKVYSFNDLSLLIGNTDNCNIRYNCPYLTENTISILKNETGIILEQTSSGLTYVNDIAFLDKRMMLKNGDTINLFGLRFVVFGDKILINELENKVVINNAGLSENPLNDELNSFTVIQDRDLYDKQNYFSKSPRIRRIIETKEINLSPPPQNGGSGEIPFIMTIAPMLTMALTSCVTLIQVSTRLAAGETTIEQSWPQLVTAGAMLLSMLVWPVVMNIYNRRMKRKKREEAIKKYDEYLAKKEKDIQEEVHLQKDILTENLITVNNCLDIISRRGIGFWDKRTDQNDFLVARFGMGSQLLDADIKYEEKDFSIDEDELRERADRLAKRYKYINNVPVSYSFYENKITAVMSSDKNKSFGFLNNVLLQLFTFYSYEELKVVVFTNEENKKNWDYIKYMNHNFTNEKNFRFFASDQDSAKSVTSYLSFVLSSHSEKKGSNDDKPDKPYYLIVIDDYDSVKRFDFFKDFGELEDEDNKGFSLVIIESRLNKLPSKCSNFIALSKGNSFILKNSYEKQEQIMFKDEIIYNINMMNISRIMSNIPIEFEEGTGSIPDAISFLEMYNVGKVEQLNVLNRWSVNDSTVSLKAEIGVDEHEDPMYLDLHEKVHGPHGLIAGTTGSGKSEFIITYILSMCINYSPDDIAFILIDYKGGGLALAFENKVTGISLPHLAGTITNLDKAEMDRTLVSIDSEVKRRQQMFNDARDKLGESTIDIYKYQRFYKEGKLDEPIPHLFIICDEFAELKAQQPDFMDNLISVARIGRSLGVHLILATQKPSGVVNEQIWSNTRFRVCLKVQDESDSKEMLKKPDAAYIRQAGRYYLQVGYDEIYALGQSGYTGAKYFPSDKIVKQVDKSINFINDCGQFIKSIQASMDFKGSAKGEQIQAVMNLIIDVSNRVNKKARRLWLENIPEIILADDLDKKYNYEKKDYHPSIIIGEYDAPEKQEQGKVVYDYLENGNTAIYGNDSSEREMFLSTLLYSTCKKYSPDEINFYFLDYGSESLRKFQSLPHVGGMVFAGEDEKYNNLLKLIKKELSDRKKKFVDYGGEYSNYVKNGPEKLPVLAIVLNNYDSIREGIPDSYEQFPDIVRDSDRYGIVYFFTAGGQSSIQNKIAQSLKNVYAFKLKEQYDYTSLFGMKNKVFPRDLMGRGLVNIDGIHEFQNARIVEDEDKLNDFLQDFITEQKNTYSVRAKRIPTLPDIVRYDDIDSAVSGINSVPVGIGKNDLDIEVIDLSINIGSLISSSKLSNTLVFVSSFLQILNKIPDVTLAVFDPKKELLIEKTDFSYYYNENMQESLENILNYTKEFVQIKSEKKFVLLIYNMTKFISLLSDNTKLNELAREFKKSESISFIIVDDANKIKAFQFEEWFKGLFSYNDGVWVGKGINDQVLFHISIISKDMRVEYANNMGYMINDSSCTLVKLIDFISEGDTNE